MVLNGKCCVDGTNMVMDTILAEPFRSMVMHELTKIWGEFAKHKPMSLNTGGEKYRRMAA